MEFYFLDAGGAGLVHFIYWVIILFMVLTVIVEAVVMMATKYNKSF